MPHKLRYARQLGYRRARGMPYMAQFGYGGKGYGGFGSKGQYGGYRSYYPTHRKLVHTYNVPTNPPVITAPLRARQASIDDWIPATRRVYSDSTTFTFALVLLVIIGLGFFFGMRRRNNPFMPY